MNEIQELGENVRKELYKGEWYYNVTDFLAVILDTDRKHAKNYYHVLKHRLLKNNIDSPTIQKIKTRASDGKKYFSDFTNSSGLQILKKQLEINTRHRKIRTAITKTDEVACFHPRVVKALTTNGWNVVHHYVLPSKHIVDIVAACGESVYVIECKPELTNSKLFSAIGQVLCYSGEYSANAIPAIATYDVEINDYVLECCTFLGIELIPISAEN